MSFNEPIILCVACRHIKAFGKCFIFRWLEKKIIDERLCARWMNCHQFEGSKQQDCNHVLLTEKKCTWTMVRLRPKMFRVWFSSKSTWKRLLGIFSRQWIRLMLVDDDLLNGLFVSYFCYGHFVVKLTYSKFDVWVIDNHKYHIFEEIEFKIWTTGLHFFQRCSLCC